MGFSSLIHTFVPGWRFFDDYGSGPLVYLRTGNTPATLGSWRLAFEPLPRKFKHLFINSNGNKRMLNTSNFYRLLEESQDHLNDSRRLQNSTSYKIALLILKKELATCPDKLFQFKITICQDWNDDTQRIDCLVSEIENLCP